MKSIELELNGAKMIAIYLNFREADGIYTDIQCVEVKLEPETEKVRDILRDFLGQ